MVSIGSFSRIYFKGTREKKKAISCMSNPIKRVFLFAVFPLQASNTKPCKHVQKISSFQAVERAGLRSCMPENGCPILWQVLQH
jgi:hypothetical protein